MKPEEIVKIEDLRERVEMLKKRSTDLPSATELKKDWDPTLHDVMDPTIRKKRKVLIEEEKRDNQGRIVQAARYEEREVNRISLPLEQDIVNIHTAFTLGTEPKLTLSGEDNKDKQVFEILKQVQKSNKVKYLNKRIMRSWLSEKEAAEYWYKIDDTNNWWKKIKKIIGIDKDTPAKRLKCVIWSPLRGDKLYPIMDDNDDLVLFTREYKVKETVDKIERELTKYMVIDKKNIQIITEFEGEFKAADPVPHGFSKMPINYIYRPNTLCEKIRTIRNRLEILLSNYADCVDYNFAPKLAAQGTVEGIQNRGTQSEIILLEKDAKVGYLTWQQSPEAVKVEADNLTEKAYQLTNTPRISFENLQGLGSSFSGVSFEFAFMGAHMAVMIHAEDMEEYLQRRVNFLLSAIRDIKPSFKDAADSMIVDVTIIPYLIKNKSDLISMAVSGFAGGVLSRRQGVILAGITDKIEEELKEIEEDEKTKSLGAVQQPGK